MKVKVKPQIQCPYCDATARRDEHVKPRKPDTVRYGCTNAHYFAVPVKEVAR
jgi:hypothetical protein